MATQAEINSRKKEVQLIAYEKADEVRAQESKTCHTSNNRLSSIKMTAEEISLQLCVTDFPTIC